MQTGHQNTMHTAHEALADPEALLSDPDPQEHVRPERPRDRLLADRGRGSWWSSSSGARTSQDHGGAPAAGARIAPTAGSTLKGPSAMSDPKQAVEQTASEADVTADQPMPARRRLHAKE